MSVHECVINDVGYCDANDRDWCVKCLACTVWNGEFCTVCGQEWGEEASDEHGVG